MLAQFMPVYNVGIENLTREKQMIVELDEIKFNLIVESLCANRDKSLKNASIAKENGHTQIVDKLNSYAESCQTLIKNLFARQKSGL